MPDPVPQEGCAPAGTLDPNHELFKPFVGTFHAEVKLWMGPGDPVISTGTMTNTLDLGGRFLSQVFKGDPNDGPFPDFEGRGFWGYNTITKKYEGFWIDTASTIMQTESGDVDESGKMWTMSGEMPNPQQSGGTLQKRSVITLVDANHHKLEMFFVMPGGESKGMEINYTRR